MKTIIARKRTGGGKTLSFLPASRKIAILAAALALGAATTAQAAIYWTGAQSAAWNNTGNWSGSSGYLIFNDSNAQSKYMEWSENLTKFTYIASNYKALQFRGGTQAEPFEMNGKGYTYDCSGDSNDGRAKFAIADAIDGTGDAALWFYNGTLKTRTFTAGTATTAAWLKVGNGTDATQIENTVNDMTFTKGTFIVEAKATAKTANSFKAGMDGASANVTINGGTVTIGGNLVLADTAGSTGEMNVNNNSTVNIAQKLYVAGQGTGTFTLNGGMVTVGTGHTTILNYGSASDGTLNLNGGTLVTQQIENRNGTGRVVFDGGTLKANAVDANGLIKAGVSAVVKAGGGTINADGKNIAINAPFTEDPESTGGGIAFTGGGTITLASGSACTGKTKVELGTSLRVPVKADLGGGLEVVLRKDAAYDVVNTLVTLTDDAATFSPEDIEGTAVPDDFELRLADGGKSIQAVIVAGVWTGAKDDNLGDPGNWSDNAVPCGTACRFASDAAAVLTNPEGSGFSPSSITFLSSAPAVTISGAAISGVCEVVSLSAVSHTIDAPVYFTGDIRVKQEAMAETGDLSKAHVTFAGGAYAAEGCALENGGDAAVWSRCVFGRYHLANTAENPWSALYQGGSRRICLADGSELHIPHAGRLTELYIGGGAKVVAGCVAMDAGGRLGYRNFGEMSAANVTMTGSGDRHVSYGQGTATPGVFKFETATNSMTGGWFCLSDRKAAASHVFYIGEGGLSFGDAAGSAAYCIGGDNGGNSETVCPWHSDFTIAGRNDSAYDLVLFRDVAFCTDDEGGVGRTITIDAVTRASGTSPTVTVSGSGTLKVNKAASNETEPTVAVADTATLAFAAGAGLGAGKVTVNNGAALEVAESGMAAPCGEIELKKGATLRFNFTERAVAPVLDMTGGNVRLGAVTKRAVTNDGSSTSGKGVRQ